MFTLITESSIGETGITNLGNSFSINMGVITSECTEIKRSYTVTICVGTKAIILNSDGSEVYSFSVAEK